MREVRQPQATDLARPYQWRDRFGVFHNPMDMTTNHLYHTLVMIWNHRMPEQARFPIYKKYNFGPFYTNDYLLLSIARLARELAFRNLDAEQKRGIEFMLGWLKRLQIEEPQNGTEKVQGPDTGKR